ncbi:hypothetical protein [Nocardioides sp. KR10-350]|uniref:hypothetical protein n=1 Tax=Nocardioides cheoyonin TaxID=3156615 RepID=UPI0032B41168
MGSRSRARNRSKQKKPPSPDLNLAANEIPELNRRFFSETGGPHVFLQHRLRAAFLAASTAPELAQAIEDGVVIGTTRICSEEPFEVDEEEMKEFTALEAIVLFHHAAETLLRLFFALEEQPPCPWLVVAGLRAPGEFAKRVTELRNHSKDEALLDRLASIFYGASAWNRRPLACDEEVWRQGIIGLRRLVITCAIRVQDEAALYNSAKHGLSAVTGQAGIAFGDPGKPLFDIKGPSLTYLETRKTDRWRWVETTSWIKADRDFGLVYLIADQLRNLWGVARMRYAGADGIQIHPVDLKRLDRFLNPPVTEEEGYRFEVPSFTQPLMYTDLPEDARGRLDVRATKSKSK